MLIANKFSQTGIPSGTDMYIESNPTHLIIIHFGTRQLSSIHSFIKNENFKYISNEFLDSNNSRNKKNHRSRQYCNTANIIHIPTLSRSIPLPVFQYLIQSLPSSIDKKYLSVI